MPPSSADPGRSRRRRGAASAGPLRFDPVSEARRHWDSRWDGGPAMMAATSVVRSQQIIQSRVEACLRPFGLTFASYEVLVLLSFTRAGVLALGKMSGRLMIHPASVTHIVDRLSAQGRVERLPHPTDRRAVLAQITDAGRQAVKEATDAVVERSFGMDGLSPDELETLSSILTKLRRAAGDFVEGGDEATGRPDGRARFDVHPPRAAGGERP